MLRLTPLQFLGSLPQGFRAWAERRAAPPPAFLRQMGVRVEDRVAEGPGGPLRLRLFVPEDPGGGLVLFLHGGGFVLGGLDSHATVAAKLAQSSRCTVVAVDYRLAPRHRYPAALEDSYAALLWLHAHAAELGGDPARIAVCGDSAGGNLSAVLCLLTRRRNGPKIAFQALLYPATHGNIAVPSHQENGRGYFLTASAMAWFTRQYVGSRKPEDLAPGEIALLAPFQAEDHRGLPPAHIVTLRYDPLRDEGEQYAGKLRAAGVPVTMGRYDSFHGFLNFWPPIELARRALEEAGAAIAAGLQVN